MTASRDATGRSLEDYPRPSLAVDTAVLTIKDRALCVLLVRAVDVDDATAWRLPGTFLHPGETLADAVTRSLRDKAGVTGLHPEQLHVFDDPSRDDRGWVLSVAHLEVVRADRIPATAENRLVSASEVPDLPFDHRDIIDFAVEALRRRYESTPDPSDLVDPAEPDGSFTLRELRQTHEAVAGRPLPPDTFRRTMQGSLVDTGRLSLGRRGKPATLFRRLPG
ncbi:NUDIX hydrolase [Cellulomonas gilvus]|uniref:NUDIX hydrolase n=1 Tax=Cellulomonas gilvus (strain ATCC 13127 / NRRL B-14078) TaxID=593907 RepID=F8A1H5_CELGA|nr:NUDIX domain-containing protein [Cellulomonas gilvus]AEI12859.1 NUDIX hydrolase [Cellulomonas gilvus ATCC 13127]